MRLFIAINFDEKTKRRLLAIQNKLKNCGTGNFSREENLHLTILFLGECTEYTAVKRSIDRNFHAPITLTFDKTGAFRGNIYWVGMQSNPILSKLYANLSEDLLQAGYTLPSGEFTPHITLVRNLHLNTEPSLSFSPFSTTADRISLMKSERVKGKLLYTEIYGKSL